MWSAAANPVPVAATPTAVLPFTLSSKTETHPWGDRLLIVSGNGRKLQSVERLSSSSLNPTPTELWECGEEMERIQSVLLQPSLSMALSVEGNIKAQLQKELGPETKLEEAESTVLTEVMLITSRGRVYQLFLGQRGTGEAPLLVTERCLNSVALGGVVTHSLAVPTTNLPLATFSIASEEACAAVVLAVREESTQTTEIVWVEPTPSTPSTPSTHSGSLSTRSAVRSLFRCGAMASLLWNALELTVIAVQQSGRVEVFSWERERLVTARYGAHLTWSTLKHGRPSMNCAVLMLEELWLGTEKGRVVVLRLRVGGNGDAPRSFPDGEVLPLATSSLADSEREAESSAAVRCLRLLHGGTAVLAHRENESSCVVWGTRSHLVQGVWPVPPGFSDAGFGLAEVITAHTTETAWLCGNWTGSELPQLVPMTHTYQWMPSSTRSGVYVDFGELRQLARQSHALERQTAELLSYLQESLEEEHRPSGHTLERLLPSEPHYAGAAKIKLALEQYHQCRAWILQRLGLSHSTARHLSLLDSFQRYDELYREHESATRSIREFLSAAQKYCHVSSSPLESVDEVLQHLKSQSSKSRSHSESQQVLPHGVPPGVRRQTSPTLCVSHELSSSSSDDCSSAGANEDREGALLQQLEAERRAVLEERRRCAALEAELVALTREFSATRDSLSTREEQLEGLRRALAAAQRSAEHGATAATELFEMEGKLAAANETVTALERTIAELKHRSATAAALESEVHHLKHREQLGELVVEEFRETENVLLEELDVLVASLNPSDDETAQEMYLAVTDCYAFLVERVKQQKAYFRELQRDLKGSV